MNSMGSSSIRTAYFWRLADHARSRDARRGLAKLDRACRASDQVAAHREELAMILLIETNERRPWMRVLEWSVRALGRRSTTCGPLQMREAPIRAGSGFAVGAEKLQALGKHPSLDALAKSWNGSCAAHPDAYISYADALDVARLVLKGHRA